MVRRKEKTGWLPEQRCKTCGRMIPVPLVYCSTKCKEADKVKKNRKAVLDPWEVRKRLRSEMSKYRAGKEGFFQFSLEEVKSVPLFKWRRRTRNL